MSDPFHREYRFDPMAPAAPAEASGRSRPPSGGPPAAHVFPLADGAIIIFNPLSTGHDATTAIEHILSRESPHLTGSTIIIDVMGRKFTTGEFLELEAIINGVLGATVLQIVDGEWADVLSDEGWEPSRIGTIARLLSGGENAAGHGHPAPEGPAAGGEGRAPAGGVPARASPGAPDGRAAPGGRQPLGGHGAAPTGSGAPRGEGGLRRKGPDPAPRAAAGERGRGNARLLWRTVRSGQRIIYDGNVVIIGDINPGGEVVATGDVVVFGTVRGIAHAGARGDEGAVVAALDLRPIQLRIGSRVGRGADDGPAPAPHGKGALRVARARGERIVVEEGLRREHAWAKS